MKRLLGSLIGIILLYFGGIMNGTINGFVFPIVGIGVLVFALEKEENNEKIS